MIRIACFLAIGLLIADGFAASPGGGTCRWMRRSSATPPPTWVSVKPLQPSLQPSDADLQQRVAALERKVADLMRQQAELDAEQAEHPDFHGRAWMGSGGVRARLGVQSSWDD
jgi:hypothetical protein